MVINGQQATGRSHGEEVGSPKAAIFFGSATTSGPEPRRSDGGDRPGGSLRGFPRCGLYLLRAFNGWTLADLEDATGVSSMRGRSHGEATATAARRIAGGGDFLEFRVWRFGSEVTASGIQEKYSGPRCGGGATAKRRQRSARGISAGVSSLRPLPVASIHGLDPHRFRTCSGGFLVAGTEPRRSDSGSGDQLR